MVAGKSTTKSPERGPKKAPRKHAASKNGASVSTADFMADLRHQETAQRVKDIAVKRLISGPELRERLGISSQALSGAVRARRMFSLQGPSGDNYYPAFFADDKYERHLLEQVCNALGDLPAGSKWNFFMTPKISLRGQTPLKALEKGKIDEVLVTVNGFLDE